MKFFPFRKQRQSVDVPVRDCRFVVLDTELTGLNERKDSIVSIGAVRMLGFRIDLSDTFNRLVRPETALSRESILIHGITPSELDNQPAIRSVLSDFSGFCAGHILVGYCVAIDMAFLNKQLKSALGGSLQNPVADIYRLYEWLRNRRDRQDIGSKRLPALSGAGLYEMARLFDIPFTAGHDALADAFITAQIFQRILYMLSHEGILNSKELLNIADPYKAED
ncbi:MAG: 3'-5' exonuclease, partial [Nitrospirae bacterium]|nr:3'-5' exonuclease [Nitrospirota bacterium]